MQESEDKQPKDEQPVDLSALQSLSFGPDWGSSSKSFKPSRSSGQGKAGGGKPPRDRRPAGKGPRRDGGDAQGSSDSRHQDRRKAGKGKAPGKRPREDQFEPVVQVLFYPEDAPFEKLAKAIRTSCRTYELFEIAQLILDKPERFVIVIKPDPKGDEHKPKDFYCTIPDNIPYETQDEAVNHVLKERLADFCTIEEVEVEAPKGSFPFVNKCPFTGVLLGPPNYHRYQAIVREHHAAKVANMPFERYLEKLEKVSEEEAVNEWIQSMTKQMRYKVEDAGSEPVFFDTLEALKLHLLAKKRSEIVNHYDTVRISGALLGKMPNGILKRSVDAAIQQQKRFPLDTANNIRGRLRRMKFNIYKRGSKGASLVCGVKRKFRNEHTIFSDSIQALVEFIDAHPDIVLKKLPEEYLGITLPEGAPAAPAEATAAASEAADASPSAAPEKLSAEDNEKLAQMMKDLRWLVSEGYVTEYGNGKLCSQPIIPENQQSKAEYADEASVENAEEAPTSLAEDAACTEQDNVGKES